jgi:hypothetical protein
MLNRNKVIDLGQVRAQTSYQKVRLRFAAAGRRFQQNALSVADAS